MELTRSIYVTIVLIGMIVNKNYLRVKAKVILK